MYHLSLGPTLFDDVDGRYRGMDGQVHQLESGAHNYSTYSLWDCYRAAYPLFTMIEPERVPQLVNTLIRMAEESPEGMPVWPLHGCETGCMTGYHSASFMADAILKGFPGIDVQRAYACMRRRVLVDDYRGLGYFLRLHYIPADREPESVSKSFEYCYGAWAVAHVAKKLGRDEDAATLLGQASNYRNYFNPATGFMQPRLEAGAWAEPFDPKAMGHSPQWRDFTESNSWQTTFGIQHDVQGVVDLFGGREAFVKKLDALFNQSSDLPPDAPPDIAGMVGQYAHGNEPSHHIAYLYVYAGAPQKTQPRVRSLMETMYAPTPDGMQGNEDVGQMSAWFMLSALGFYSVDPVSGVYVIGSPLFDSAVVQMGGGRELRIEVVRPSPDDVYVHAISLNGASLDRLWFRHSEIVMGGRLTFRMGPLPSPTFGVGDGAVVPPHLVRKV
jgi:predicted alpha-1,2-mannosidase